MTALQPPVLPVRPIPRTFHGDTFHDPYEWVREGGDEVVEHLHAENAYADAMTQHLAPLREELFEDLRRGTQEDAATVPYRIGQWWYWSRTAAGEQYCTYYRAPLSLHPQRPRVTMAPLAGEQLIIDGDALRAREQASFFALGGWDVSEGGERLLTLVDTEGDEEFTVIVTDLTTGEEIERVLQGVGYGACFTASGEEVLYVRYDEAWRSCELWVHRTGQPLSTDQLLLREDDERFRLDVFTDVRRRWALVLIASAMTSEWHVIDLLADTLVPQVLCPREPGVTYEVDVLSDDEVLVRHDRDHKNGSLAVAPLCSHDASQWREVLPGSDDVRLEEIIAFPGFAAVATREEGSACLRMLRLGEDEQRRTLVESTYRVDTGIPMGSTSLGPNLDAEATTLLVRVESGAHPPCDYEVNPTTGATTLLHVTPVPGLDAEQFHEWREWAVAEDGTRVPMSMLARRDVPADGTAPALLIGYGAYETCYDPGFRLSRLNLASRGVVVAIAHVRGGGEMGRSWYEGGRLGCKRNSFTDFISCADHLVRSGWAAPGRIVASGRSAGGLLMGAVTNLAPERFAGVVAGVPFVDALTTILMPEMPLTVGEWEEWGDPLHDPEAYRYMKGYTPYENIAAVQRPRILATTSLNDSRVSYVEPLKWVAALRATAPAQGEARPVLLRCEMVAGHGGPSGRYSEWRELAWEHAFVLDALGATG